MSIPVWPLCTFSHMCFRFSIVTVMTSSWTVCLCVCVCVCVHWVLLLKGGREGGSGGERDGVELSVLFCASPVIQDDKLAKFRLTFFEYLS